MLLIIYLSEQPLLLLIIILSDCFKPCDSILLIFVVSNVSKVINLKAIHNDKWCYMVTLTVVSNVSKVINLGGVDIWGDEIVVMY